MGDDGGDEVSIDDAIFYLFCMSWLSLIGMFISFWFIKTNASAYKNFAMGIVAVPGCISFGLMIFEIVRALWKV
jgi:TRAP-type C4-dicarboxylate transport system permease small subunit